MAAAAIASVVFEIMDEADLRQWSTLPATLQMIRIPLAPGKYNVRVLTNEGAEAPIFQGEITIRQHKK